MNHLLSEIVKTSTFPTSSNHTPKLPPQIEGIEKEDIETALAELYRKAVETRGNTFRDISQAEVAAKLRSTAEWVAGHPLRSGLLLQGTVGSGKTTVLYALYALYKRLATSVAHSTAPALYEHFRRYQQNEMSYYPDYRQAKYLFLDDLGTEPARCLIYGTEYTPLQELIDYRYTRQLPTVITTNLSDTQLLERYGDRFVDRIAEMFTVLRFKGKSYRG